MSAMVLSTHAMDRDVSGDALLTWMHMARSHMRQPAIVGEHEALSLLVQLMVGVLLHQAVTWTCHSRARCSRMIT